MKNLLLFFLLLTAPHAFTQQPQNPYGLTVVGIDAYKSLIKAKPDHELVELKKVIPSLVLDIRYATTNNFMKQVMYKQARAFARKPVAAQLKLVQEDLKKMGLGLKIYDAYRPYTVTVAFYQKATDKAFVANPKDGSRHNRGCAIDLGLVELKSGKTLVMPTGFDSFSPMAAANYEPLPAEVLKNRHVLIDAMQAHGFKVLDNEWWHFDFNGWKSFELLDIPFESL